MLPLEHPVTKATLPSNDTPSFTMLVKASKYNDDRAGSQVVLCWGLHSRKVGGACINGGVCEVFVEVLQPE
jgi:hypothetical protein